MRNERLILVVDDEDSMRTLLRDFLLSQGYQVDCYSTARGALKTMEWRTPHAVVSDVRMTPIDGLEFLRQIKAEHPSLPVILFTSAGTPDERDIALQAGAAKYFTKPFPLSELKEVIEEVMVPPKKLKP